MTERSPHEHSDVPAHVPVWAALGTLALLVVTVALVIMLTNTVWAPPVRQASPFAGGERPSPVPPLQQNPQADLDALQQRWRRRLHTYGWRDRQAGIVHIPINVAMDRLAARGLPNRGRAPGPVRGGAEETGR